MAETSEAPKDLGLDAVAGESGSGKAPRGNRSRGARATGAAPYPKSTVPTQGRAFRVYVGNVSWASTWADLKEHFKAHAFNVVRADIPMDGRGRSRGFGIVELESAEDVARAITELTDTELGGRKLFVREDREEEIPAVHPPAREGAAPRRSPTGGAPAGGAGGAPSPSRVTVSKTAPPPGTSIHVSNLPYDITWKELKDIFQGCGKIVRADIAMRNERSQGWGTVQFSAPAEAARAIKEFHKALVNEREIAVRLDQPRPPRTTAA